MIYTIHSYIEKYRLLSPNRPVLVGLSGGADSVALLRILIQLGYPCVAAHCNFHLRGEESDRDEEFAEELSKSLGVQFIKTDFDTTSYAAQQHISIEMAARELRYAWFEKIRQKIGAQAIAVAHHRDDSVETILMNLVRGTGVRGLGGIRPVNGQVVRPLLCVGRKDILDWLFGQGFPYVTDSTNLSDAYTRNFVRLRVLPLLEEINPSARDTIARSAEHLSAVEEIYLSVLEKAREEVEVRPGQFQVNALTRFPAPDTILYELLKPYGFNRAQCGDIFASLAGEPGKLFYSPSHCLLKDRELLITTPLGEKDENTYSLAIEEGGCAEPIRLSFHIMDANEDLRIEKSKHIAYLDYDKLHFPLTLRKWKKGDWFIPFGMKGRKKLSDYFSDRKINRLDKKRIWLLCSGEEIVWLVGERPDNRFRVEKATKRVLVMNFSGQIL